VLALPRGGVPVGYEVARALNVPLDIFVVRKLLRRASHGGNCKRRGSRYDQLIEELAIPQYIVETVTAQERRELERRERLYRGGRPQLDVRGRTVILIDDGLATGFTMRAAIEALRQLNPASITVAVPAGSKETCNALRALADDVVDRFRNIL
jgi:predicted phosphoribosyltransferase